MQVASFGTKYKTKNKAILACNTIPKVLKKRGFAKSLVSKFRFKTVSFNETFQSYGMYRDINNCTAIITTSLSVMCADRKQSLTHSLGL